MSRLPVNGRQGTSHPGALPLDKPIFRSVPPGSAEDRRPAPAGPAPATSRNTAAPQRTADGKVPSLAPEPVCPFCGLVKEKRSGRCPRCTMEDSPVTRQATQAKMGGWYVYQAHNPSTPGMNFSTLAALIRRGRVTRKSIVRGPTTGQFWRFAVRTKGVSREFGLCWNCGQTIDPKSRLCPRCKHWQEPPVNPDVFLEGEPLQSPSHPLDFGVQSRADTMQPGVNAVQISEAETAAPSSADSAAAAQVQPAANGNGAAETKLVDAEPQPPATLASSAALAAPAIVPASLPVSTALTVIDMGRGDEHALVLGRGLAAFNLPPDYALGARPRHVLRSILLAGLLSVTAFAAFLYFNPELGQRYLDWGRWQLARWAATEKLEPPKPAGTGDAATARNHPSQPTPMESTAATAKKPTDVNLQSAGGGENAAVEPKNSAPMANQIMRTVRIAPSPVAPPVVPVPPASQPAVTPETPGDLPLPAEQAMTLWSQGIAAQEQGNFALAVQKFQAIKKLPQSVWPMGLELRLEMATQKAGQKI